VFGVSGSLVVDAREDAGSPVKGMRAVHYDFRLAKAAPGESGRVGADPTTFMPKAAE
jgi:hydroxyquinol 1,2-dioxygenase